MPSTKLIAVFVALLFQGADASACLCEVNESPSQQQIRNALYESDYVALVEVISTTTIVVTSEENVAVMNPTTGQSEETLQTFDTRMLVARISPLRIWKGNSAVTTVETTVEARQCGLNLEIGAQYLVYASVLDDDWRVGTNRCTRTTGREDSSADVAVLDAIEARFAQSIVAPSMSRFDEALVLIHSYSGAGDERQRAMAMASELLQSAPESGFFQALAAENLSTWELDQLGKPVELRSQIIELADEALRLNPTVAQAHVAKARVYTRASMVPEAEAEIAKALSMNPALEGAVFMQAEIYRRLGTLARGERWYREFIRITPDPVRKSNGYAWLGTMYRDAAKRPNDPSKNYYLSVARDAFQHMVDLNSTGAWTLVNFAIFLNGYTSDFDAAEKYAERALAVMEFPMARFHLAAARYQKLHARGAELDWASARTAIAEIEASTHVSLEDAIDFDSFVPRIRSNLSDLLRRAQVSP